MLLAGIPANSIHSLWKLSHGMSFNGNGFLSGWRWEPSVAVGSRDHLLVSSSKERMSRRNLSRKVCVLASTSLLNYQHSEVAHATQASFSSDAQLCSCHNCFSHYRQPLSLHQSVLIFEWFAAANAKALIFLYLVHTSMVRPNYAGLL